MQIYSFSIFSPKGQQAALHVACNSDDVAIDKAAAIMDLIHDATLCVIDAFDKHGGAHMVATIRDHGSQPGFEHEGNRYVC